MRRILWIVKKIKMIYKKKILKIKHNCGDIFCFKAKG